MLNLLVHWYQYAEVYAVIFSWIVVPLGYYAAYLFLRNHYGIFQPKVVEVSVKDAAH